MAFLKKRIKTDHIVFTILFTVIFVLITVVCIPALLHSIFAGRIAENDSAADRWIRTASKMICSFGILAVMRKIGILHKADYAVKPVAKGLWIGFVGVLFAVFQFADTFLANMAYAQTPDFWEVVLCVLAPLAIGWMEEVTMRGFTYNNMKRYFGDTLSGVKKSILWSSLLFGVLHLTRLRDVTEWNLESVLPTVIQVIYASVIGIYFALVYVQSKSMWTVVIIHAMIDVASIWSSLLLPETVAQSTEEALSNFEIIFGSLFNLLLWVVPFSIAIFFKWRKLKTAQQAEEAA